MKNENLTELLFFSDLFCFFKLKIKSEKVVVVHKIQKSISPTICFDLLKNIKIKAKMKIKSEKNVVVHKFQKSISPIFCFNSLISPLLNGDE